MPSAGETFLAQLAERLLRLLERVETHAPQHLAGLRELDVAVVDDLDVIAPWVVEAQVRRARDRDVGLGERRAHAFLVVDDETEVTRAVLRLRASARQGDELVAHVDERHLRSGAAAQLELEEAPVPRERLV